MKVLDEDPGDWILLEDARGNLHLDVNCGGGLVGYSVLIELDAAERRSLREGGRAFLGALSRKISDSAPATTNGASPYAARDLTATLGRQVMAAVRAARAR